MPTQFINTPLLQIAYETHGPETGEAIVLLHGWPDSVRTWDRVAPQLAAAGKRVFVPHLRGFGPTRFLEASAMRSGQATALAQDYIDFIDALQLEKPILVGHDWGGRIGYIVAALFPQRVKHLVDISVAYEPKMKTGEQLPLDQIKHYFYQWFLHSERSREMLSADREKFCRFLWHEWAPNLHFTEDEFAATAEAWHNPDWIDITIHSYRHRWHAIDPDPRYDALEKQLAALPTIHVPTTLLHGEDDSASLVTGSANQQHLFDGPYERKVLKGVGHFVPREQPEAIIAAVLAASKTCSAANRGSSAAGFSPLLRKSIRSFSR